MSHWFVINCTSRLYSKQPQSTWLVSIICVSATHMVVMCYTFYFSHEHDIQAHELQNGVVHLQKTRGLIHSYLMQPEMDGDSYLLSLGKEKHVNNCGVHLWGKKGFCHYRKSTTKVHRLCFHFEKLPISRQKFVIQCSMWPIESATTCLVREERKRQSTIRTPNLGGA